ncbi:MAG: hypothetical protein A6F70_05345 [Cycloclasticus sp. symbiont of Bathymodiolus heckerae]|nr:MAG: hypothetical protein A6F70_05345 [Cycloclasticus sp. symbiont of Bathymodiolus heckerae]
MSETLEMRKLFWQLREVMLGNRSLRGKSDTPDAKGLIDQASYDVIEVDNLLEVVDHTQTLVGKDVMHKAFSQQMLTPDEIKAKQHALQELVDDDELRQGIEALLKTAATHEDSFYRLLFSEFVGFFFSPNRKKLEQPGYGYRVYKEAMRFLPGVVTHAEKIKPPKSIYLKNLLSDLAEFATKRECKLMNGPVYKFFDKFLLASEKKTIQPAIKFRLTLFKPLLLPLLLLPTIAIPYVLTTTLGQFTVLSALPVMLMLFYIPIVCEFDNSSFIVPLKQIYAGSADVERVVQVIGQLDELMSYHRYAEKNVHNVILPTIKVANRHCIQVEGAVNPVLGLSDETYVPNNFDSSQHNLSFFTGPNSGGKTAFCKTLAQIQLLSQIGCYIPADSATLTVADRVYYQTPEINSLDQDVGRFGTELKRTRNIFTAATPHTMVILDELAEGTTHKEKIETSLMILEAFKRLGSLTILVTHNHELAEHYLEGNQALCRQVEFDGQKTTHRFIDGISVTSHANIVANYVGFSKNDIESLLKEKLIAINATDTPQ